MKLKYLFVTFGAMLLLATTSGCIIPGDVTATPPASKSTLVAPTPTPQAQQSRPAGIAPPPANSGLPPVTAVAEKVRPAVVAIRTQQVTQDFFLQPVPLQGAGSGFIIDKEGHIVTNNHVIEGSDRIRVTLVDGRSFTDVKVIGRDALADLAVIQIQGNDLPVAPLGDSRQLEVGDWVVAIGNALGLEGGPTVTVGVVSALERSIRTNARAQLDDLIQTDAAINPGNSGGPLVNLNGEVVGINTAIDARAQGIGFAISIDTAKPLIQDLITKGRVVQPWVGIFVQSVTPSLASELNLPVQQGVLVSQVDRSGPARNVLRDADIITSIDGSKVNTVPELQRAIRQHKVGDEIEMTVLRGGSELKLRVKLEEMPRNPTG